MTYLESHQSHLERILTCPYPARSSVIKFHDRWEPRKIRTSAFALGVTTPTNILTLSRCVLVWTRISPSHRIFKLALQLDATLKFRVVKQDIPGPG
jgi:hypothetical protein